MRQGQTSRCNCRGTPVFVQVSHRALTFVWSLQLSENHTTYRDAVTHDFCEAQSVELLEAKSGVPATVCNAWEQVHQRALSEQARAHILGRDRFTA
jgi:hypothetical protein